MASLNIVLPIGLPRWPHLNSSFARFFHGFLPRAPLATSDGPQNTQVIHSSSPKPLPRAEIDTLLRSPSRKRADAWVELLDTYLPKRLRRSNGDVRQPEDDAEFRQDIDTLPALLAKARAITRRDLFSFLVADQGRWEAVIWLMEAMLEKCHNYKEEDEPYQEHPTPLWMDERRSLNELTLKPFNVELPHKSRRPLAHLLAWESSQDGSNASSVGRHCLGEIWQSLGCMILLAEDRSVEDPSYQAIMSLVLDILSQMHHINAVPPNMYNYTSSKDSSVVQRPPTLYLLSARIMTVLSDVAWKKHWLSEMAKAKEYGYELPPARVQPQLPRVGAEVWLEFVLWACVEGGWITEAARVVSEMENRKSDRNRKWSVISWDDVCRNMAPKLEWTAILKLQIDKARLNQSTGIGIANSGTSSVDMGVRTVSREVILAIMDGISNRPSTRPDTYGDPVTEVQQHLKNCRHLLERHQSRLGSNHFNTFTLRTIESAVLANQASLGTLSSIININPIIAGALDSAVQSDRQLGENGMDPSAAILGLLHRMLFHFSDSGNFEGSLQTLRDIQSIIDANRNVYIEEFANELRERLLQGQEDSNTGENLQKRPPLLLHPQIPVYALARLLDFVAENKFTDLGQWLMHNNDVDGGIIHSHMFDDPNLQPALLRFATANADDTLLTQVLEHLQPPLSGSILRPLLRCQIVLNKWNAVEVILRHFRDAPELSWASSDAMAIAAAILKMLHSTRRSSHLGRAFGIIKDMLQGRYDPPQSPSRLFDPSHLQRANQLKRILHSVPGQPFEDIGCDAARERGRYSNITEIPPRAFNILLEAVVEQQGCAAGQALFQRWCLDPAESCPRMNDFPIEIEDRDEKVVIPTVYMLRTVVRPLAQRIRQQRAQSSPRDTSAAHTEGANNLATLNSCISDEDRSVIRWAVPLYRKFGMDGKAINKELPGAMRMFKQKEPP